METRYFYSNGIHSVGDLHAMGISLGKQTSITLVIKGVEIRTYSVSANELDGFSETMILLDGTFVDISTILDNGGYIRPVLGGVCLILLTSGDILLGELSKDGTTITYNDITESMDEFYAHGDRMVSRDRVSVYHNGEEVMVDVDDAYIVSKVKLPEDIVSPSDLGNLFDSMVLVSELGMEFGAYEVTRALYKNVMGEDPSSEFPCTIDDGDRRPVDNITLERAIAFCNNLSLSKGLVPFYTEDGSESSAEGHKHGYRIPTKDEWEFAASAGISTKYSGTNGSLPEQGNDAHQMMFTSEPVSYELNSNGVKIPVYDSTSSYTDATPNTNTNPNCTSIANLGDPELSKYAWTKYNVRTGDVENVPQPESFISGWGQWNVFKYNGFYYKSNAYGVAGVRGDVNDGIFGTRAVGTKLPNAFGLYDMTGNVSELTITGGTPLYVGGDVASNTSKLTIGHVSYEAKVKGLRVCRNV